LRVAWTLWLGLLSLFQIEIAIGIGVAIVLLASVVGSFLANLVTPPAQPTQHGRMRSSSCLRLWLSISSALCPQPKRLTGGGTPRQILARSRNSVGGLTVALSNVQRNRLARAQHWSRAARWIPFSASDSHTPTPRSRWRADKRPVSRVQVPSRFDPDSDPDFDFYLQVPTLCWNKRDCHHSKVQHGMKIGFFPLVIPNLFQDPVLVLKTERPGYHVFDEFFVAHARNSLQTCSVCSPRQGAGRRGSAGVLDSTAGSPRWVNSPISL